MTCNL